MRALYGVSCSNTGMLLSTMSYQPAAQQTEQPTPNALSTLAPASCSTPQITEQFSLEELHPGLTISVELESQLQPPPRYQTTLVGWSADNYLLLCPQDGQGAQLFAMSYVILRYVIEGEIHAFKTQIMATTSTPERLIFCRYPEAITSLQLRQHTRYPTRLLARIETQEQTLNGLILDISRNGCQFIATGSQPEPNTNEKVLLTFPFLRRGKEQFNVEAVIRNTQQTPAGWRFGIEFNADISRLMTFLMLDNDQLQSHLTQP